jgi:hypothetical protein
MIFTPSTVTSAPLSGIRASLCSKFSWVCAEVLPSAASRVEQRFSVQSKENWNGKLLKKSGFEIWIKSPEKTPLRNRPRIEDLEQFDVLAYSNFGWFFETSTFSAAC